MSTPEEFIHKCYPHARDVEKETGIPAIAILAQASLESGYGKHSIGNNIFGIKYKKGDWGYQEVLTTEHSIQPFKFANEKVKSKIYDKEKGVFIWKIWSYFADYPTIKDAFAAHSKLLLTDRYKPALRWKHSPVRYLIAIWQLGYATDSTYDVKMEAMVKSVERRLPKAEIKRVIETMKEIESIQLGRIAPKIPKKLKLESKLTKRL